MISGFFFFFQIWAGVIMLSVFFVIFFFSNFYHQCGFVLKASEKVKGFYFKIMEVFLDYVQGTNSLGAKVIIRGTFLLEYEILP